MTSRIVPNPFPGEQGVRIEKALRHVLTTVQRPNIEDILGALRLHEGLSDNDFRSFFRALQEPRLGFEVERWVMTVAKGEVR